jgi:quinoprotein glucose dehydrogenase
MFTPPSVRSEEPNGKKGSIVLPGVYGGGNWNNGAFDPDSGMYYAVSHSVPWVYDLVKPNDPKATLEYGIDAGRSNPASRHTDIKGPEGLPLIKPPYGRITAYDLNKGEKVWTVANGDGPRNHPLLKGLNLPPLGVAGRPAPLLTKTLLFIGEGSDAVFSSAGGKMFRAYDKATGEVVWETELPAGTTGAPMTYLADGKQFIVVPVGAKDQAAEWVALSLP